MLLELSDDDVMVLFEYFERFRQTKDLSFIDSSEYIALGHLHEQVMQQSTAVFKDGYRELLKQARRNLSRGFNGNVPCLKAAIEH